MTINDNTFAFTAWLVRNTHVETETGLTERDGYEWYNYMWDKWLHNSDMGRTIINDMMNNNMNNNNPGTIPKTLQTDNGAEFVNSTIQDWAKQQNIHLSRSATYQATSNALIENFNNLLRKMIKEGNIRNNSLNWINHLSDYLYNRNHSKHGTTKYKPVELWRQGREKLTKENTTPELIEASDRIKEKARKALASNKAGDLQVGDHVRIYRR
jgi:transposase InsO family protein